MVLLTRVPVVHHCDDKKARRAIYSIDVQPIAGGRLATAGYDCSVKIWDTQILIQSAEPSSSSSSSSSSTTTTSSTTATTSTTVPSSSALLATLCAHTRGVNIVRWSKDGVYLASGSDDFSSLVYRHAPEGSGVVGSFGSIKNTENWIRCFTLRGHTSDVLDLDWSPRGYLASASIDNQIMIWACAMQASNNVQAPLKILTGHTSNVRGLSFDPIGRYLASSGADNVIILWDCNQWTETKRLDQNGPLKDSPNKVMFQRLSWAPDGSSLCVTACLKASKSASLILKRGTWESVADLLGHEQLSLCSRFCPKVLTVEKDTNNDNGGDGSKKKAKQTLSPLCSVAIGDQNGVISVWTTSKKDPVVVIRDMFDSDVTDLSWLITSTGNVVLLGSSRDGTIILSDFGHELGKPMDDASLDIHFQSLYGRAQKALHSEPAPLVDNPIALKYMSKDQKKDALVYASPNSNKASGSASPGEAKSSIQSIRLVNAVQVSPMNANILALQKQSKTKDGKKRVQPVLVQQQYAAGVNYVPTAPSHGATSSVNTTTMQMELVREAPLDDDQMIDNGTDFIAEEYGSNDNDNDNSNNNNSSSSSSSSSSNSGTNKINSSNDNSSSSSSNNNNSSSNSSSSSSMIRKPMTVSSSTAKPTSSINSKLSKVAGSKDKSMRSPTAGPGTTSLKRDTNNDTNDATRKKPRTVDDSGASQVTTKVLTHTFSRDDVVCTMHLSPQEVNGTLCINVKTDAQPSKTSSLASLMLNENLSLHAAKITSPPSLSSIPCGGGIASLTTLKLLRGNKDELWTTVLAAQCTCMCGIQLAPDKQRPGLLNGICSIGCVDGTLQVLELGSGIRITSPLVLGATVAFLDCMILSGAIRLVAVTAHGDIWLWEIVNGRFRCILKENLRPVLVSMKCGNDQKGTPRDKYDVGIESCILSAAGVPVIYVRSRGALGGDWQAFAYNEDCQVWTRIADLRHVMSHLFDLSSYNTNVALMNRDPSKNNIRKKCEEIQPTIPSLESAAASEGGFTVKDVMTVARVDMNQAPASQWADLITLSHAEERMANITSDALGGTVEAANAGIKKCFGEWISMCCRVGYVKRVLHVSNILLKNAREKQRNNLTNELENTNTSSLGWLLNCSSQESIDLLTTVVLPAIGRTGTLVNVLGDLHEQLEELQERT